MAYDAMNCCSYRITAPKKSRPMLLALVERLERGEPLTRLDATVVPLVSGFAVCVIADRLSDGSVRSVGFKLLRPGVSSRTLPELSAERAARELVEGGFVAEARKLLGEGTKT